MSTEDLSGSVTFLAQPRSSPRVSSAPSPASTREKESFFIEDELVAPPYVRPPKTPNVQSSDLLAERGTINVLQHKIRDVITNWKGIGLEQLKFSLDEQAVKVSELKEDYVKSRKVLAANIKAFSATYLKANNDNGADSDNEDDDWRLPATELVEMFKNEYDKLSIFAKFSETSFLAVFKVFRDAEDPVSGVLWITRIRGHMYYSIQQYNTVLCFYFRLISCGAPFLLLLVSVLTDAVSLCSSLHEMIDQVTTSIDTSKQNAFDDHTNVQQSTSELEANLSNR